MCEAITAVVEAARRFPPDVENDSNGSEWHAQRPSAFPSLSPRDCSLGRGGTLDRFAYIDGLTLRRRLPYHSVANDGGTSAKGKGGEEVRAGPLLAQKRKPHARVVLL
jgi:hypothetical protein